MSVQLFGHLLAALLVAVVVCAVGPAVLFCVNLRRYRAPLRVSPSGPLAHVAVLIPARNEAANIHACVEGVLASRDVVLTVLVLDDASTDATGAIVRTIAASDPRVRLVETQSLPAGWNGKQRACWLLAQAAVAPIDSIAAAGNSEAPATPALLLFLDADVRLAPDAVARCAAQMHASRAALVSGFPCQITVGWMEKLLLPLIHFVLLGFLPLGRMRAGTEPAYAAGCGQFFLVDREAYFVSGGHRAIRETRHDGLRLPVVFRRHGYRTDLVDLTDLAEVRMYDSGRAVWMGLAKNATEGLGSPARIVPFTLLLMLGQVMPLLLAMLCAALQVDLWVVGATFDEPVMAAWVSGTVALALVASYLPRLLAVRRFRQPVVSALLHPLGVTMLLAVQWYALGRQVAGRPVAWRARSYASGTGEEIG